MYSHSTCGQSCSSFLDSSAQRRENETEPDSNDKYNRCFKVWWLEHRWPQAKVPGSSPGGDSQYSRMFETRKARKDGNYSDDVVDMFRLGVVLSLGYIQTRQVYVATVLMKESF